MAVQTWLISLDAQECAALLARSSVGRLGLLVDGRPEIYPVNHVYDPGTGGVVFPTSTRSRLLAALDWPYVAYEVDGGDDDGGWSVLVVGHAEELDDAGAVARFTAERSVLWGAGAGTRWLRVVPHKVTGRRINAVVATGRD